MLPGSRFTGSPKMRCSSASVMPLCRPAAGVISTEAAGCERSSSKSTHCFSADITYSGLRARDGTPFGNTRLNRDAALPRWRSDSCLRADICASAALSLASSRLRCCRRSSSSRCIFSLRSGSVSVSTSRSSFRSRDDLSAATYTSGEPPLPPALISPSPT